MIWVTNCIEDFKLLLSLKDINLPESKKKKLIQTLFEINRSDLIWFVVPYTPCLAAVECECHLLDNTRNMSYLQHIVQGQVPEGLAAQDERLCGLLCFVHLVPRRLSVLHLSQLHILTHAVKLLLGVLELTYISGAEGAKKISYCPELSII